MFWSSCVYTLDSDLLRRSLERPIIHRYKEIEEFPQALNNSQMWNFHSHLFLTEAKANLTRDLEAGVASGQSVTLKYTKEELDEFDRVLREHEAWLDEWVEKQKSVKMNEDPVILSSEMRARAKVLENHLQKLYKKRPPKAPKKSSSSSASANSASESATGSAEETTSTSASTSTGRHIRLSHPIPTLKVKCFWPRRYSMRTHVSLYVCP